jgi:hypothetical protein
MLRACLLPVVALLSLAACSNSAQSTSTSTTTATGASTTTGGSGGTSTSTGTQPTLGQAITAPSEQWTWVPFDNAYCGNGTTTGIGVNLSSKSSKVLLYLEGGGACWSDATCYTLMTAANFTTGYGEADFTSDSTSGLAQTGGFFDRTDATNPFQDYSYVYVPYCTGDVHAGNNVYKYPSGTGHHVGFTNMSAYLARIVPTFPSADRVILTGSSAGGFGAAYNWWQTQQYFGGVRVDMIDDSGTAMPPDIEADGFGESQLRTQWNLAATLPPGCTGCATRLDALYGFYAQQFPTHRAALLSYVQDTVLPAFYGISTAQFSTGLQEEITTYFTPNPKQYKYFTVNYASHVLWFGPPAPMSGMAAPPQFFPQLHQFVTQMVTDDAAWADVQL